MLPLNQTIKTWTCSVAIALFAFTTSASARDWVFRPSTFTHSQVEGERINQFAPPPPVYLPHRPDYRRSGFHQTRSSINIGGSQDQYHTVERWGEEVRPYGEWLYPYRPYSVPYDAWGPPFGGVNADYQGMATGRGDFGNRGYRGRPNRGFGGAFENGDGPINRRRQQDVYRRQNDARVRGLFDGREIPGDDQHYLERRSNLDHLNDREFYHNPRNFRRP